MAQQTFVTIPTGAAVMEGMLEVPDNATGIVLFAHGSGSSRLSPRNNYVAGELRKAGIATLLLDLLTPQEDLAAENRFDIALLTGRLDDAASWLAANQEVGHLLIGLFGASTGAAAALRLAAARPDAVACVVSRGGRPDLAGADALRKVRSPTLLIVGGDDSIVIDLNRRALAAMICEKELVIVPGATHLFEERGTLEEVARLATNWFRSHCPAG